MKRTLNVLGMSCNHCAEEVKTALLGVGGVLEVEVKLEDHTAIVTGDTPITELVATLADLGYAATIKNG